MFFSLSVSFSLKIQMLSNWKCPGPDRSMLLGSNSDVNWEDSANVHILIQKNIEEGKLDKFIDHLFPRIPLDPETMAVIAPVGFPPEILLYGSRRLFFMGLYVDAKRDLDHIIAVCSDNSYMGDTSFPGLVGEACSLLALAHVCTGDRELAEGTLAAYLVKRSERSVRAVLEHIKKINFLMDNSSSVGEFFKAYSAEPVLPFGRRLNVRELASSLAHTFMTKKKQSPAEVVLLLQKLAQHNADLAYVVDKMDFLQGQKDLFSGSSPETRAIIAKARFDSQLEHQAHFAPIFQGDTSENALLVAVCTVASLIQWLPFDDRKTLIFSLYAYGSMVPKFGAVVSKWLHEHPGYDGLAEKLLSIQENLEEARKRMAEGNYQAAAISYTSVLLIHKINECTEFPIQAFVSRVHEGLGQCRLELGNPIAAAKEFTEAFMSGTCGDSQDVVLIASLVKCYLQLGENDKVEKLLSSPAGKTLGPLFQYPDDVALVLSLVQWNLKRGEYEMVKLLLSCIEEKLGSWWRTGPASEPLSVSAAAVDDSSKQEPIVDIVDDSGTVVDWTSLAVANAHDCRQYPGMAEWSRKFVELCSDLQSEASNSGQQEILEESSNDDYGGYIDDEINGIKVPGPKDDVVENEKQKEALGSDGERGSEDMATGDFAANVEDEYSGGSHQFTFPPHFGSHAPTARAEKENTTPETQTTQASSNIFSQGASDVDPFSPRHSL